MNELNSQGSSTSDPNSITTNYLETQKVSVRGNTFSYNTINDYCGLTTTITDYYTLS